MERGDAITSIVFRTQTTSSEEQPYTIEGKIEPDEIRTIRDLISYKIKIQVEAYNALVDKAPKVTSDNRYISYSGEGFLKYYRDLKKVNIQTETKKALDSFKANELCIFIDNKRYLNLSDHISLKGSEAIVFLKLVPLIGG